LQLPLKLCHDSCHLVLSGLDVTLPRRCHVAVTQNLEKLLRAGLASTRMNHGQPIEGH
jgi:hypothetical protein